MFAWFAVKEPAPLAVALVLPPQFTPIVSDEAPAVTALLQLIEALNEPDTVPMPGSVSVLAFVVIVIVPDPE